MTTRKSSVNNPEVQCPLCLARPPAFTGEDRRRSFYRCSICDLVFVAPSQHLTLAEERAQYAYHQNCPSDERYRTFLKQLFVPVNAQLSPGSHGLDFGCGPGPTLHLLFEEAGHHMTVYDPAFAPDEAALSSRYDFITMSEVVEHLHHPFAVLERLWALLRPGGVLGIMTQFLPEDVAVAQWFYKNDDTHVCFFSTDTFAYLAKRLDAQLQHNASNVALLYKRKTK